MVPGCSVLQDLNYIETVAGVDRMSDRGIVFRMLIPASASGLNYGTQANMG